MTSDAGRFQLNSARLECKGDAVRLHGTDGHRMAQAKVAAATGHGELLVPRQAVKMLATLPAGGDADIATVPHHGVDGNVYRRGVVDAGPWRLAFRIGEATFPDCDKVAGGLEPTSRAHVDRETLERVVRRAKELSGLRLQALRLTGEAGNAVLHVEAENVADLTLVRSDLAADLLGAPPRVAAQAAYVLDFLRVCRARKVERIAVESAGPETLTRWLALGEEDGTEWAHYIMPMRDEKL
jgi:DNA polymerase III sliding clamp (beta) subunit (PCNA family)